MEYLIEPQEIIAKCGNGNPCYGINIDTGGGCLHTDVDVCAAQCGWLCGSQMCSPRMDSSSLN